jgi:hypothetical protein
MALSPAEAITKSPKDVDAAKAAEERIDPILLARTERTVRILFVEPEGDATPNAIGTLSLAGRHIIAGVYRAKGWHVYLDHDQNGARFTEP